MLATIVWTVKVCAEVCHTCRQIEDVIRKQNTNMRDAICPKKQLMVTLNWYATGHSYTQMESTWKVGKSTVHGILHRTTGALYDALGQAEISFPTTAEELQPIMTGFERMAGLPQCAGVMDGCFIPMKKPHGEYGDQYWCHLLCMPSFSWG